MLLVINIVDKYFKRLKKVFSYPNILRVVTCIYVKFYQRFKYTLKCLHTFSCQPVLCFPKPNLII